MIHIAMDASDADRALAEVAQRLRDMTPAMRAVGRTLHRSVMENFKRGGRPRWKALRDGSGRKPLMRTGRLRDSISWNAGPKNVSVGTGLPYAAMHQFGGRAGGPHGSPIPARPFLAVQPGDHAAFTRAIEEHLTGGRQ